MLAGPWLANEMAARLSTVLNLQRQPKWLLRCVQRIIACFGQIPPPPTQFRFRHVHWIGSGRVQKVRLCACSSEPHNQGFAEFSGLAPSANGACPGNSIERRNYRTHDGWRAGPLAGNLTCRARLVRRLFRSRTPTRRGPAAALSIPMDSQVIRPQAAGRDSQSEAEESPARILTGYSASAGRSSRGGPRLSCGPFVDQLTVQDAPHRPACCFTHRPAGVLSVDPQQPRPERVSYAGEVISRL